MSALGDPDVELTLLASVLEMPQHLKRLLVDDGLQPQHFFYDTHAAMFAGVVAVVDRGENLNRVTLRAELERSGSIDPERALQTLDAQIPDLVEVRSYARRIRDLHRRRQIKLAAQILIEAADRGDPERLADAEALLTTPEETERTTWTGKQLAEMYFERMDQPAAESFKWPFSELDKWTGGIRRRQIVLIGGWTSNGKSVFYDQVLEKLAAQGLTVHSYINEMSIDERMDRTVARLSGVPFSRVYGRDLEPEDETAVMSALTEVRVGMTECAGWTAAEIARHIRWNRWDVAGVDIIHEIAHREERDLAEIAQTLRAAAKQTGCALIACVHLNDNRVTTPQRPRPVLRDVRGSGMLVRGADVVLLVHRDDDEDGVPTNQGLLLAAKIRNGQPNVMGVMFEPQKMRFLSTMGTM